MTGHTIIEHAEIIDGTGAPPYQGAVELNQRQIKAVHQDPEPDIAADRRIDVSGNVVCPGFIDTHSHSDLRLFDEPTLPPKIRQGITTEILGQDGFSVAPMYRDGGAKEWEQKLSGLDGRADINWTWDSVADYFEAIEDNGVAPNVAMLVGHGTVRFNLLGMSDAAPSPAELEEMGELVEEALSAGAIGFSTGLVYTPCTYASTDEVQTLAGHLTKYQRPFVAHIRSEGRWIWDALDEFVDIGDQEDIPLHLSHFKVAGSSQHGKADRAIQLIETAAERGVRFTVDQYPYTAASTLLSSVLPPWVHAEDPQTTVERLKADETRERIRRDIEEWRIDGWENFAGLAGWNNIIITNVRSETNEAAEGNSVADIAAKRDEEPVDVVCDLLVDEELEVSMIQHLMTERDVREILSHERVNIATDGLFGGKPHPRVYGSYPRILGHYVRDENLISLEEAIRKMTSLPARAMGLHHKGIIRSGMDADLVVFDPASTDSRATFDRPKRHPRGVHHVIVNGEFVVRNSETTGKTPGSVLRQGH